MSLRNSVKRQVRLAFNKIGDLKTTVTFTSAQNESFDFGRQEVVVSESHSFVTQGVFIESKSKPDDKSLSKKRSGSLIFNAETWKNNDYDKAFFNNTHWRVVPPLKEDGYLVHVNVTEI